MIDYFISLPNLVAIAVTRTPIVAESILALGILGIIKTMLNTVRR